MHGLLVSIIATATVIAKFWLAKGNWLILCVCAYLQFLAMIAKIKHVGISQMLHLLLCFSSHLALLARQYLM